MYKDKTDRTSTLCICSLSVPMQMLCHLIILPPPQKKNIAQWIKAKCLKYLHSYLQFIHIVEMLTAEEIFLVLVCFVTLYRET